MRHLLVSALLLFVAIVPARADFDVDVTTLPNFTTGLTRVAVIAVECHESVDCAQVEDATAQELSERKPSFEVLPPSQLRAELFARGATVLTNELRPSVLTVYSRSESPLPTAATASAAPVAPRFASKCASSPPVESSG
jgi:hypothetical protein